jgi:hypothetical protein
MENSGEAWCFNSHLNWKVFPHPSMGKFIHTLDGTHILENLSLGVNESLLLQIVEVMTLSCTLDYGAHLNRWFPTSNSIVPMTHENVMIHNDPLFPPTPIVLGRFSLYIMIVLFLNAPLQTLIEVDLTMNGHLKTSCVTSLHRKCLHIYPH